jgi:thiamine-monophosphate kinase
VRSPWPSCPRARWAWSKPGRSLLRSGARPGDRLCVTGFTGLAAAAQKYFGNLDVDGSRLPAAKEERLLAAWKRPQALIKQGRCLSSSGVVTSCQDSSDGLKAGIQSIAAQNAGRSDCVVLVA